MKAQPATLKGPLKNPNTERSISSLTVMTPAIRQKKKYCQYPQKMLLNSVKMTNYESKTFAHMELAGALVKMQVNSVASCNVLSRKLLPKDSIIDRTDVKLTTYSKARLKERKYWA